MPGAVSVFVTAKVCAALHCVNPPWHLEPVGGRCDGVNKRVSGR